MTDPLTLIELYNSGKLDNISTSYWLLKDQPATLTKASYYKHCFILWGKIGPLYYMYTNNGEYRTGFDYEEGKFTLSDVNGLVPSPEDDGMGNYDELTISLEPLNNIYGD